MIHHLIRITVGVCLCVMTAACSKSGKTNVPPEDNVNGTPFTTPRGATTGPAVTANIGPAGGQLASADNNITLVVPAGALTSNQTFSIQPVENMFRPDAEGRAAYRLLPENVEFAKPVTITMKYDPNLLNSGAEDGLSVAYQTATGHWIGTDASVNKNNHTLTVNTTHFSDYAFYETFDIFSDKNEASAGEMVDMKVGVQLYNIKKDSLLQEDKELLIPPAYSHDNQLTYAEILRPYASEVSGWKIVSGGGQLTPSNNAFRLLGNAKYKAPDAITTHSQAIVEVTLTGNRPLPDYSYPGGHRPTGKIIMRKIIKLRPPGYMTGGLNGDEKNLSSYEATIQNGISIISGNTGNINFGLSLAFGGSKPGSYDCGKLEPNNGKAEVTVGFTGPDGEQYVALDRYCQSDGTNSTPKYSSGKLIITRADNIVEGSFSGPVYHQVKNDTRACQWESKTLNIKFSIVQ